VIFFYELLFVLVAIAAVVIGEMWSRVAALILLCACFLIVVLAYASFGARLAASDGVSEDDRRWLTDARDGLRHLRLLVGLAVIAALVWRLVAG
jgi:hypothetical protein